MRKTYEPAVFRHDLSGSTSLDPKGALNIALAKSRCKSVARQVYSMWPNLRVASEKLAGIVTALHPSPAGDLLLPEVIKRAFGAFKEGSGKDIDRACEYLTVLLSVADDIVKYRLYGRVDNSECVVWEPFSEPVGDWARRNAVLELAWEEELNKAIPESYQWILAAKILTYSDTDMVMKYKSRPKRATPSLRVVSGSKA